MQINGDDDAERVLDALEYFVAGVPPGPLYKMSSNELREMVRTWAGPGEGLNTTAEVGVIGLVAYTEAFFKHQFAALINVEPEVLLDFREQRGSVDVDAAELVRLRAEGVDNLGFLVAESLDFGSSKKVNAVFRDLLRVTPFSSEEAVRYDKLLTDRNLLVHHAGIYTSSYRRQRFVETRIAERMFFDSLVVRASEFVEWADFADAIVEKTVHSCHAALSRRVGESVAAWDAERQRALECLNWFDV